MSQNCVSIHKHTPNISSSPVRCDGEKFWVPGGLDLSSLGAKEGAEGRVAGLVPPRGF